MDSPIYCYQYRLPGSTEICGAWSNSLSEQPEGSGFLISPFLPHSPLLFIRADYKINDNIIRSAFTQNNVGNIFSFPTQSTTKEEHAAEVLAIINQENQGTLDKAVAARCLIEDNKAIDVPATFRNLCERYPDAFVFLFSTPESGTWMGASPELLLQRNGNEIQTMALAGTRRANDVSEWDTKNSHEQSIVTDYILNTFRSMGLNPVSDKPTTRHAGNIEHIMTTIKGTASSSLNVLALTDAMSPTPALCGMPRELAASVIARSENFDRAFYGGFCGPWDNSSQFKLFVNLRSGWFKPGRYCLYAGGGIMPQSDPESEWWETANKLQTIKSCI